MAATLNLEIGDLIEIFRGIYQHWAVYIGDGYVIHLGPLTEEEGVGAFIRSELLNIAIVKKEKLVDVVKKDKWRINNLLDKKYDPRPDHEIIKLAKKYEKQEQPYSVFGSNCEHFATRLRYDRSESRQVHRAVLIIVGVVVATIVVGAVAVALNRVGMAALFAWLRPPVIGF